MSSLRSDEPGRLSWRKTVSEKLNSRAIVCLISFGRGFEPAEEKAAGTLTMASWLPLNKVVVNTSIVLKLRESDLGVGGIGAGEEVLEFDC